MTPDETRQAMLRAARRIVRDTSLSEDIRVRAFATLCALYWLADQESRTGVTYTHDVTSGV